MTLRMITDLAQGFPMYVLDSQALSSRELAKIGKVVVTFAEFECELLLAFQALQSVVDGVVKGEGPELDHFHNVHDSPLSGRIKEFVAMYKRVFDADGTIMNFERQCDAGLELRDSFAHGVWSKVDSEKLKLTFYSRKSRKKNGQNVQTEWSISTLDQLANANQQMTCWLRSLEHRSRDIESS